ncbi:MAG: hypothetical protein JNN04_12440 [Cyclobacteriaceae bacterium]|nr:hypothetical protein [Cyclobacteriaceae bacterium]
MVGSTLVADILLLMVVPISIETLPLFNIASSLTYLAWLFWILSILVYLPLACQVGNPLLTRAVYFALFLVFGFSIASLLELPDSVLIRALRYLTIASLIGVVGYAAYLIKLIESKERVSVSECLGVFMLIWLFPIGIWVLQPRLNELASKGSSEQTAE